MNTMLLGTGARLAAVADDRFQTVRISAHFMLPLQESTAAENAILPRLLTRGCAAYPDYTRFNRKLAMLYGASVYGSVQIVGETQVLSVSLGLLDDRFVPDKESVLAEGVELLCGMLFDPALENGCFRAQDLAEEKRSMAEEIRSEFNDKRTYALRRCRELMFDGEPFGLGRQGTAEQAEKLTAQQVTAAWKRMLETAQLTVMTVGTVDAGKIAERFRTALGSVARKPEPLPPIVQKPAAGSVRTVTERTDAQQAKLVMGFRTPVTEPQETMALRLACALYGQTPTSRLFQNVRERLSLCYYCVARYDRFKGVLFVDSGVQEDKAEEAKAEILRQLSELQAGRFTEEELQAARLSMMDQIGTVSDSPAFLDSWYVSQLFSGHIVTPEQAEEQVRAVTVAQAAEALRSVQPELVYLLAGKQEKEADAQ